MAVVQSAEVVAPLLAFIHRPEPLNAERHAHLTLGGGGFAFTADRDLIPITFTELPAAAISHPVVVVADPVPGLAIAVGLEAGENLLVDEGRWPAQHYLPRVARLYPFAPVPGDRADTFALVAEMAAPHLSVVSSGEKLFAAGRPGSALVERMQIARALVQDLAPTAAFVEAMLATGVAKRGAVASDGGAADAERHLRVDPEALADLAETHVVEWHRRGWIAAAVLMAHAQRHWRSLRLLRDGSGRARRSAPEDGFVPSAVI